MLRLSQSSLGHIGLAFAVSASALMLVLNSGEAAARALHTTILPSDHWAQSRSGAAAYSTRAGYRVAQQSGGNAADTSNPPDGTLPSEEHNKPVSADLINKPADASAEAAPQTSSEPTGSPSTNQEGRAAVSPEPQQKATDNDASQAAGAVSESAEQKAPPDMATQETAEKKSPVEPAEQQAAEQKSPADAAAPQAAEQKSAARPETQDAAQAKRKRNAPKPHPLAAAQPGMDVIVCEAGCTSSNEAPQAVYAQPTTARDKTTSVSEMKPTSTAKGTASDPMKDMIVCLGGCYDTPKVYRSTLVGGDVAAGTWSATVVPTSAKPAEPAKR